MAKPPLPHVSAFLIADSVFPQAVTNKWCIIGTFEKILAEKFPTLHHSLGLFLVLSDAEGAYDMIVEFRDSEDRMLTRLEGLRLEVKDRLSRVQLGIQTGFLPIPAPGKYFFKLYFNGQPAENDIPIEACLIETESGGGT